MITNPSKNNNNIDDWIIVGISTLLNLPPKKRGNPIDKNLANLCNDTMRNCNLINVGFNGDIFIWSNNKLGYKVIQSRLDKSFVLNQWMVNYINYSNNNLFRFFLFDHNPIMLFYDSNFDFRLSTNNQHYEI